MITGGDSPVRCRAEFPGARGERMTAAQSGLSACELMMSSTRAGEKWRAAIKNLTNLLTGFGGPFRAHLRPVVALTPNHLPASAGRLKPSRDIAARYSSAAMCLRRLGWRCFWSLRRFACRSDVCPDKHHRPGLNPEVLASVAPICRTRPPRPVFDCPSRGAAVLMVHR
jgi:hypothetical protein